MAKRTTSSRRNPGSPRRYVGNGTDLAVFAEEDLGAIEHRLNTMPRRVLGWKTVDEVCAEMTR